MKSYIAKAQEVEKKWFVVDAAGKPLGRVASQVASILRGKHKPTYTTNADAGDHVIVINCDQVALTGKKLDQKIYRRHSGYIGGMKETTARVMIDKNSGNVMTIAIKGMLPKTRLGRQMLKKLRVYAGSEHENIAQKPEIWNF